MPAIYKVLGQALPTANTFWDIYAVPGTANAIVSTVNICNTTSSNVTFRMAVRPGNATISTKNYIAYDTAVAAQDALSLSLGMTMGATDSITVFSFQGNVSFSVFGTEIYF
jgi:hypothetical protein